MKSILTVIWGILVLVPVLQAAPSGGDLTVMVLDQNSYTAHTAVGSLDIDDALKQRIHVVTVDQVRRQPEAVKQVIAQSSVVVVDVMGRELTSFLTDTGMTPDDPAWQARIVYALRGSLDDEGLKQQGFVFDAELAGYYRHMGVVNFQNMVRRVIQRHLDPSVSYDRAHQLPDTGIYHPDAPGTLPEETPGVFHQIQPYLTWQADRPGYDPGRPVIGFVFFSSFLTQGQKAPADAVIRRLESEGFNVIACFGREAAVIRRFFLDSSDRARVHMLLSFSFKFNNALTPELSQLLTRLDVPVFNAVSLYRDTREQWRQSPVGINVLEVAWSVAVPEISGLIEPTVLSGKQQITDETTGKSFFISRPVTENVDRLIPRLKKWAVLQTKPNKDKKIALMFYNHHQGKQNIGASYLNVFRSVEHILSALADNGYTTGDALTEHEIKDLILASGRNVGSWAPGELEKMAAAGQVIRLPIETYAVWFENLPKGFQNRVIAQWGKPADAQIMVSGSDFIIPAVQVNHILLLPEPARGWDDDVRKLYHDTTLYPHHQYLAVYLWLKHRFKADAMIHLGTHATYEWTPGKQAGLSPSCAPEMLTADIPNLYPYIVDNLGEGVQAKRRGRGVMISHLTPVLRKADISEEYSRMAALVGEIEQARARGSLTVSEKTARLMALAESTGILEDLSHAGSHSHDAHHSHDGMPSHTHAPAPDDDMDETIHLLGHYLEEIKSAMIPYGMHTFGRSPVPEASEELVDAVVQWNDHVDRGELSDRLARSGPGEIESLLRGLSGRYVHPGQGNDPIRNPDALPTGKNFFGANPGNLPSPAAWQLGKKAAQQIIDDHLARNSTYPAKVAVVLWATEMLRNEGVNESTILYLIGVRPKWSKTGRILGMELIKGQELNRPRIDVMINASGLYRDLFPDKMRFLDQAVRLAERQTDVENLIARNTARIKTRLIGQGMDPETADEMSRFRVFSEPPGAYGNGVSEMASGSSKWDDPDAVVEVYENRVGYAFGQGRDGQERSESWGIFAKDALKAQLAQVDTTVHSRSSNVYGLLDNDDMFQYLGGLAMAVTREAGRAPRPLIIRQQTRGRVQVESLGLTLGREMRARYLNPKWISGMKVEGYAGARAMSDFVEYLWGWDMTTEGLVDEAKWQQTYEVYVTDKYDLDLKAFFDKASPWAFQSIAGRMLETHRKGYWQAGHEQLQTLAAEYAGSVVSRGIACCDHTCNNPLLNQMVVSIISIPGVVSPELAAQFKLAVEQMARQPLDQQVEERHQLIDQLNAPSPDQQPSKPLSASADDSPENQMVEGYKMEKIKSEDDTTQMTSSGIQWMAVLCVIAVMALVSAGACKSVRRTS